ncbi:hypothetical protein BC943DRAFT_380870 [Umbelopsis sp. AD052]|nr:hypothetical protein BC943DRAFT_380870 [Umbelopsis sp. AD052]
MSLDNVTVNMSRLALARAIKTPDGDDSDADPWDKSVIFHQSHIPKAIEHHKGQRRGHTSPNHRQSHKAHQTRIPHQSRQPAKQRVASQPLPKATSLIQVQSQARTAIAKPRIRKTYIPSDDEDEEEEEDQEDDSSSDSDAPDQRKQKVVLTPPDREEQETISKNKATRKQPLPSDDESSASDSEDADEDDGDASSVELTPQRHSDLQARPKISRASSGSSSAGSSSLAAHQRSRSLGDMMEDRSPVPRLQAERTSTPPMDQWRRSADPYSRPSDAYDSHRLAAAHMHNRSRSSERMDKLPTSKPSTPVPGKTARRRSTIMEYEGLLQQQQIMQAHHAQQMSQIQHYQSGQNKSRKSHAKRASMSGMDMLLQHEQEKQSLVKNKSKKLDSTNAPIEGLLGKLPESGAYNVNFQQLQGSRSHGTRNSMRPDGSFARDSHKQAPMGRPNSAMGYFDTRPATSTSPSPDNRRSRLSPWMEAPYPTSSISTPATHLQRQYQQQMMMLDQQQQMMQNQFLVPASMLQVPMNYGQMMPPTSPDLAMRQGIPRPVSSMSKRSSFAWGT